MEEQLIYEDPMGEYLAYLSRYTRITEQSQWEAHQLCISREVARSYGVTQEQLIWLDENL